MKRLSCSDSLGAVLFTPKDTEKKNPEDNCDYSREFQAMLDGLEYEDSMEESGQGMEKKRRLRNDQVKALERIFEVDNKLDPERKMKLAQELGLQPRQVSIWFQNRRARRKTKQLERDYDHLKANYEALKLNYRKLEEERENFNSELKELKSKLGEEKTESNQIDKENTVLLDSPIKPCIEPQPNNNINLVETKGLVDFKDNNFNPRLDFSSFSSSLPPLPLPLPLSNYSEFLDSRVVLTKSYHQVVKVEEKCPYNSEESCNIFSVDQAPSLCWYFPDQRS